MDPRESLPTSPDAARARLVTELRARDVGLTRTVQNAFARVPRHIFVPEVGPAAAYRDEALVIKCGPDGLPVSSSSQPAMMAIMLEQLDLGRGHRVLEIGTGSGYNAAVMAEVVGPGGQVVSIDIDPELVARAEASLNEAGYFDVSVLRADGGYGAPGDAPFDRIIVTAGAWDIAPAWLDQLGPGGRLVLPLSLRGMQLSVALERAGEAWVSKSAWRCGFVPMLGDFAGPERVFRLDEPQPLVAQMSDGSPIDGLALRHALTGPATHVGARAPVGLSEIADLDLWLTLTSRDLARLTVLAAPGGWLALAPLLPVGGLIGHATDPGRIGVAILVPTETAPDGPAGPSAPPRVAFSGLGPGGATIAAWLADMTIEWAARGRPGAHELELTVRPTGVGPEPASPGAHVSPGAYVMRRPSVTIQAGWPD
jgi:protein-L-isoaspartate(D-aspartate) O-methyltransferase